MNKFTDDRYETRRRDNGEQARYERKVLMWLGALIVIGLSVGQALATPWTDENGKPNPECYSEKCNETGEKDPPPAIIGVDVPHRDPAPLHGLPEVHNGFSCYYAAWGAWVFHAAARPVMTMEHVAAAKQEALGRRARLGDAVAMTKVCKPWQVRAGFEIAEVL